MKRRAFVAGLAGCAMGAKPRKYSEVLSTIESKRKKLAAAYAAKPSKKLLASARKTVRQAVTHSLFPAWMGTDWDFHGTATEPHDEDGIACGYFVATMLQHAGLRLSSRRRFGQAPALAIQKALTPDKKRLHRIYSVPAKKLEQRIRALGDGLYLIGLNIHIGFVIVRGDAVRFVHSSYTDDQVVIDELLVHAEAIHASRKAGYFVTSLFEDQRLIRAWLKGTTIAAPT